MTVKIRRVGIIVLLVVLVSLLTAMVFSLHEGQGEPDFLAYWSAAHLLAKGENPYDDAALQAVVLETRPGRRPDRGQAFASWNPPWLLAMLLPFGYLPFDLATRVWMVCSMGIIVGASMLAGRLLPEPLDKGGLIVAAAAGLLSGQALVGLLAGQVSHLVLAGLILGVWCLQRGRDRCAGAAFFLMTIKPHVSYLVLVLLLLWVVRQRRWGLLWGMGGAALISMLVLSMLFPRWLSAYLGLMGRYRPVFLLYTTTTIGNWAHARLGTDLFRFAGILLALSLVPLLRLADARGRLAAVNAALLISVPLAMYGFPFDHVVLVPTVIQTISWLWRRELSTRWVWATLAGLGIFYFISFGMIVNPRQFLHWFTWSPLGLAALYALAWRQRQGRLMVRIDRSVA